MSMVPTGTGKQEKPGKMGKHFPVREKSENLLKILEKSEKIGPYGPELIWHFGT